MMLLRSGRNVLNRLNCGILMPHRRCLSVLSSSVMELAGSDGELRVFIFAGEVSGDTIASRLMASLKKLCPFPVNFSGVGGTLMCKEGLQSLFPMEDLAVMGLWELLPHLNKLGVRLNETIEAAVLFQPHVVVTVDSKGFSFRLLKRLRARCNKDGLDAPVHFHYVAPSFWAWKGGEARLRGLANFVDHIFCILPNEEEVCKLNGLAATFVGHPILEDVLEFDLGKKIFPHQWKIEGNCEDFRQKYAVSSGATIISLLPGSRLQEVTRLLSIFSDTMEQLKDPFPELMTVIHVAPNQHVKNYIDDEVVHKWPVPAVLVPGGDLHSKYNALSASRVALCASGTVALELQLARLPCVVAYRAHILTAWFIRRKAKIPYISLPNILLDSPIIPEALFEACTPAYLSTLLTDLILKKELQEDQIVAAEKVIRLLFPPKKMIGNLLDQDREWGFPNYTPSLIAASTILSCVKPRGL